MTVPGGQEQGVQALVQTVYDGLMRGDDGDSAPFIALTALRVRADQAEQLLAAGEGRVREIVDDVLLQRADRAVAEAESLRQALRHPRALEQAALDLARAADDVDRHIMDSHLAQRRDRLRHFIGAVETMVEDDRNARRAALAAADATQERNG